MKLPNKATILLATFLLGSASQAQVRNIDLTDQTDRQVVVDREKGQYLGHPTTVLLEDGKTMLCVYPKGHGKGGIVYKRSSDGGKTWTDRLPTPESWATSKEVPTMHRVIDAKGKKRIIMWSGLYPARLSVTEDDGTNWSELAPVGDWGGIVVMGTVIDLKTGPGHYMAFFHDDGRFMTPKPDQKDPIVFTLFTTTSTDGGLTWAVPKAIYESSDVHLCEPGALRSPDGKQIAVLLRENARRKNTHIIFSDDEGKTWTAPREVPASLNGDRHTAKYTEDGRLFISFRSNSPKGSKGPYEDDWVAWVGTYKDLVENRPGQYHVRLKDNHKGADCAYPGVELLPDDTVVTTTYGHWEKGAEPYILSVRLKLGELDEFSKKTASAEGSLEPFLGEPELDIQPIFKGERFPNIVVTNAGTVLATWGNTQVRSRRSEDGGKTWGDEIVIAKPGFQGGGTTVDETTGDILAFVEDKHPPAPLTIYRSKDDGKTWKPETPTIKPNSRGDAVSMHMNEHGITLRHGKHAGRLIRPTRFYGAGNRPESIWHTHYTNAMFSDDGGKTWQVSEPFPENGTGEATLAELSDGRIYYNSRVHWQERPKNTRRREAWSNDGGKTWTDFKVIDILPDGHQHRSYGCMGGLTRLPIEGRDILIFSNIDTKESKRERATVWASFDGGKTWPVKRLVFDGSGAYSSMNVGRLGTPSEGWIYLNFESEGQSKVARFNLKWLLKGEATGDGEIPKDLK